MKDLAGAIADAWMNLDKEYFQTLYHSIFRRLISAIEKKVSATYY